MIAGLSIESLRIGAQRVVLRVSGARVVVVLDKARRNLSISVVISRLIIVNVVDEVFDVVVAVGANRWR